MNHLVGAVISANDAAFGIKWHRQEPYPSREDYWDQCCNAEGPFVPHDPSTIFATFHSHGVSLSLIHMSDHPYSTLSHSLIILCGSGFRLCLLWFYIAPDYFSAS